MTGRSMTGRSMTGRSTTGRSMTEPSRDALLAESLDIASLPAYPSSKEELDAWSAWIDAQLQTRRLPQLGLDPLATAPPEDMARRLTAWRAALAHWADKRTVSTDDAPQAAYTLLARAHEVGPFACLAARHLTWASLRAGSTSTDALFLASAWAWPLRDIDPALSEASWRYLIHAPWQTDALSIRDVLLAAHAHLALRDGRTLMALIEAKLDAGRRHAAREWLEAVALIQARRDSLAQITSYRDFATAPLIQEANEALARLAQLYVEDGVDQVWARELLKRAAELTRSYPLIQLIESRVWDRPAEEAYRWTEHVTHPRMLDDEIARALHAGQPHHARRLAEAMLVRKLNRVWVGSAQDNLPSALERFERELAQSGPPKDALARRASEHLAILYVRTHHVSHQARLFVHGIADSIAFTGRGAALYDVRDELELFYNHSDPYHVLRLQDARLSHAQQAMSEDERAASDEVERWFQERFRAQDPNLIDRFARWITAPLIDVARYFGSLHIYEEIVTAAMHVMTQYGAQLAGDLDEVSRQAALIRSRYGHGVRLMEYARQVTSLESLLAAGVAAGSSILSPGLSLVSHAADLGASLLLAFRAVARIAAVFGRDLRQPEGFRLVADSFTLGFSSPHGEGLVPYLSRPREEMLKAIAIGGVTYGTSRLVEHLWIAPNQRVGERASEQAIRHLARILGMELSHTQITRVVPLVGAVISGVSTWIFMRKIIETAIHVAARDA